MRYSILPAILLALSCTALAAADDITLKSPSGDIAVTIACGDALTYAVAINGTQYIAPSPISMTLMDGKILGGTPKLLSQREQIVKETILPAVREKRAEIPNVYNQMTLAFDGGYSVIFRAFDDGVAYRFVTALDGAIQVKSEQATFAFAGDYDAFKSYPKELRTSFESEFKKIKLSEWEANSLAFAPILVKPENGPSFVVTEADIDEYPGMFLTRKDGTALAGEFAPYPAEEKLVRDRALMVEKAADYIATGAGSRTFPWRVIAISKNDAALIENDIVYRLGPPLAVEDTSWIKPGKVAWDWWNANNLWGVDFESGVNTDTYKYYIDFASRNKIEYVILDEGWSNTRDLYDLKNVDLHELIRYGQERNVGLILWCVWITLDNQMDALAKFEEWGVKGVKVDFMDRDDQKVVQFYHKLAKATAEHHLLLDFHGAFKPDGLRRAYPNLITREGIMGMEYCKWSKNVTPEHDVTIPFTRMVAGPMDFTPGAMNNAQRDDFFPCFNRPMSQGTRCHQLAMYVVYESPLMMLCDSPSAYERQPECTSFIASVPTTWDETRALDGEAGKYVVVARRHGDTWFLGAMTGRRDRVLTVDLSFLGEGTWTANCFADGPNANKNGIDFKETTTEVTAATKLDIPMAEGGGWAARFTKVVK